MKRALIADDDTGVCSLMLTILEGMGLLVSTVHTGREAFSMLTSCRDLYDVAIIDVIMPEWTGPETVEMVRGLGVTTPIILVSGHTYDTGIAHDIPFLHKPFSPSDFRAIVTLELEKPHA